MQSNINKNNNTSNSFKRDMFHEICTECNYDSVLTQCKVPGPVIIISPAFWVIDYTLNPEFFNKSSDVYHNPLFFKIS